jgi:hypothetical protein
MRSHCCLGVFLSSPHHLKAGIVEPEGTVIVRRRIGKHVPAAPNTHARIEELWETIFSMWSVSYKMLSI